MRSSGRVVSVGRVLPRPKQRAWPLNSIVRHRVRAMDAFRNWIHLSAGLVVGAAMLALAWGMAFPESPLYASLASAHNLREVVKALTIPAMILTVLLSGGGHGGGGEVFLFGVFVQWFVIGALASWAMTKIARAYKASDA